MRRVIKEGTIVKIKNNLESGLTYGNDLFFNSGMEQYRGQELKVAESKWDRVNNECRFKLEGVYDWTFNLEMIEEVSEENMRDLDRVCSDCDREIDEGEELVYLDRYDRYVCEDCLSTYYRECYECNEMIHVDDLEVVYDDYGDEVEVCESCRDEYYTQCSNCLEYHRYGTMHDDGYDCYCDNCWEDDPAHLICGYHEYDRDFEFYKASGEENPPRYIGSELEMENDTIDVDSVRYIKDELNGITAHDGSLDGRGSMEWVDHPRTLLNHYEIADIKRGAFERLVKKGYRSNDTNTCGLHFHVSRPYQQEIDKLYHDMWTYSSDSEEYKKLQAEKEELEDKQEDIINRIILVMETYKEELIKFSRRKSTYWCQWLSDVVTTDNGKITSLDYIKKVKHESYGHHRALNLENHNTIEFRIFKGTLNFNTYMASLELVNNIVELCSDLKVPVEKITWDKLTSGQYVKTYVDEKNIHTNRKVVDTSEIDRIWNIIKNKKRVKIINKIIKEFDKYYQTYLTRFDNVKNTENWTQISETASRLREYTNIFKQVVDYKKNQEYDNLVYKLNDMYNYNMYFDNEVLQTIRDNIRELLKEAR